MKTLDFLNLNEAKALNIVAGLQQLLADFQVHYTNLRGFHWEIKGRGFFVLHEKFESMYDDAAAKIDGANGLQQFFYITMPQMWYSVFFSVVFSLINAFKCFREILLIGGNHPYESIYMLQHYINNTFENMNYPKLAVASVLLLVVLVVVFVISYKWVMKKEEYRS